MAREKKRGLGTIGAKVGSRSAKTTQKAKKSEGGKKRKKKLENQGEKK